MNTILRVLMAGLALAAPGAAVAAPFPVPPCGPEIATPVPAANGAPRSEIWHGDDLVGWQAPACLGAREASPILAVALAGAFAGPADADALLAKFGAISQFVGLRYWSVTDRRQELLVRDAYAVTDPVSQTRRADFTPAEMRMGRDLYFVQQDNRSTGMVVFRTQVSIVDADRFVIAVDNVTPVRFYLFDLYPPGTLRTTYVVDQAPAGHWHFYSLTEVEPGASSLALQSEVSYVNRARAFYDHVAGPPGGP